MTLKVINVSFTYGSIKALSNITFYVGGGEVVSVIGPNGAGKTTLLHNILAILKPSAGTVLIDGVEAHKLRPADRARLMSYVPQVESPQAPLTVMEYVMLGRTPHVRLTYGEEDVEEVVQALKELGIEELASRKITELSGGEWMKAVIARAITQKPRVLLLDEPTNHLDIRHQLEVLQLIRRLMKREAITTLMAIHDVNLALRYSDKVIALKKGVIAYCGEPTNISKEVIDELYEVKVELMRDTEGKPVIIPLST